MLVQKPVNETIFDARDDDISSLRIVHAKGKIGTVPVRSVTQFAMQFREVLLKMKTKVFKLCGSFLPTSESKPTMPESRYTEINGHASHHQPNLRSLQASCRHLRESE